MGKPSMEQRQQCVSTTASVMPIAMGRVYAQRILPPGYKVSYLKQGWLVSNYCMPYRKSFAKGRSVKWSGRSLGVYACACPQLPYYTTPLEMRMRGVRNFAQKKIRKIRESFLSQKFLVIRHILWNMYCRTILWYDYNVTQLLITPGGSNGSGIKREGRAKTENEWGGLAGRWDKTACHWEGYKLNFDWKILMCLHTLWPMYTSWRLSYPELLILTRHLMITTWNCSMEWWQISENCV